MLFNKKVIPMCPFGSADKRWVINRWHDLLHVGYQKNTFRPTHVVFEAVTFFGIFIYWKVMSIQ